MRDARPAGDERHPRRLLVEEALVAADPMLAAHEAVVGEIEDVGVAAQLVALELVDERPDALVDGEQRLPGAAALAQRVGDLAIGQRRVVGDRRRLVGDLGLVERRRQVPLGLLLQRPEMARRRHGGAVAGPARVAAAAPVRGRVAELEVERRRGLGVGADEALRLLGEDVGAVVLLGVRVLAQDAVLVQRVVEVLGARGGEHVPVVPALGHVARHGPVLVGLGVPVLELADVGGLVPGALEPERQVVVAVKLVEDAVAAVRGDVGEHVVVVRVLAGEDRRPRRAAEREVVVEALHRHALALQLLADDLHHPHRAGLLVVGEQDDDVRLRAEGLSARAGRAPGRPQQHRRQRCDHHEQRSDDGGESRPPGNSVVERFGQHSQGIESKTREMRVLCPSASKHARDPQVAAP